jgi:hypothetical protein
MGKQGNMTPKVYNSSIPSSKDIEIPNKGFKSLVLKIISNQED